MYLLVMVQMPTDGQSKSRHWPMKIHVLQEFAFCKKAFRATESSVVKLFFCVQQMWDNLLQLLSLFIVKWILNACLWLPVFTSSSKIFSRILSLCSMSYLTLLCWCVCAYSALCALGLPAIDCDMRPVSFPSAAVHLRCAVLLRPRRSLLGSTLPRFGLSFPRLGYPNPCLFLLFLK